MVTYLFSYCYVIVQNIYFSLFAMGFVTVYGMFCIQHFLTELSGNSIQEPTNTKDLSCNALRNKHTVNEYDVRCPVFTKFRASSSKLHPEIRASLFLSCHLNFLWLHVCRSLKKDCAYRPCFWSSSRGWRGKKGPSWTKAKSDNFLAHDGTDCSADNG